jgi:hypothetical protein
MNMKVHTCLHKASNGQLIHMPSLATLIMSTVAGPEIGKDRPSDMAEADQFFKISAGLITLTYLIIVAVMLYTAKHKAAE